MSLDTEILKDFIHESKNLIQESCVILGEVEENIRQASKLDEYGNLVDRIMGGAKNIALMLPPAHALHLVSSYAELCKAVGYKTSQITNNEQFFNVCVALLQDATETLDRLLDNLDKHPDDLRKTLPEAFIERLRWISNKFNDDYRASVNTKKASQKSMDQNEIDALIKKMGL